VPFTPGDDDSLTNPIASHEAHHLQGRTARWSTFFLDKFVAPGISEFTNAVIPEMSEHDPESKFWLANFVLNSGFGANFNPPGNAYAYNYLRRAVAAFSEHEEARQATQAFLSSGRQSLSRYAAAVLHWEFFLGQSWHAYLLLRGLFGFLTHQEIPMPFVRGERSVEERLNDVYNHMKHVESRIENGQMIEGATIPVWLTNDGLRSTDALLTYAETAEVLRDLAKWANIFVDPRETANKLRELRDS
jgi:hypothetical protein